MARAIHKLTDAAVRAAKGTGRHSDGGGLYLNIARNNSKSWVFMWTPSGGSRREMGLGSYPAVSLAMARKRAETNRQTIANGRDPIEDRRKEAEPTFAECVDQFLDKFEGQWRNAKHKAQWRMTLTDYCRPIEAKRVSEIETADVLRILNPIWQEKQETASRLRGRIERVLDFAKVKGWRSGENPALWRGNLKNVLPARQKLQRGHHAAMPFDAVPAFVVRLQVSEAMAARALELLILTAARSGEVLGAKWDELDFEKRVWTVPAVRMKAKTEHRVPLSSRAIEILKPLYEARVSDYVFPGHKENGPLSVMAMTMLMRRMKADRYTVHGFRSAFRDWVGEETQFPREVAEAALAHQIGNAVERAYRRGDALEKRHKLMEAWERYLLPKEVSKVVPLRA
ncbi:integrase arm-type DNA-binding domain-containing protein [Aquibium sp. LZ166]|uniref:Integrase arm-type DNA-binding domain-containing protein n=1 Tax=Aquibium pacificus TaxID=3153579 RepID=A0ABV3SGP5_9HYPH